MVGLKGDPHEVTEEQLMEVVHEINRRHEFTPIEEIQRKLQDECEIKWLIEECKAWGIIC